MRECTTLSGTMVRRPVARAAGSVDDWLEKYDAVPVAQIRLEIQIAPSVYLPPPDQRLAADLVTLNPGERLVLDVGIAVILDEEVLDRFVELARARLDRVLPRALRPHAQPRVTQRELPVGFVLGDVVLAVLDVAPALDYESLESLFGELLRGPAAGDAGPDHDGVVGGHDQARPTEAYGMSPRYAPKGLTRSSCMAPNSDV